MVDLDRLVAIEAIRSLQSRYVRLADSKDWGALARLFLPHGTFMVHDLEGRLQLVLTGREQIIERLSHTIGGGATIHHLLSYEIEIEAPARAHGVWAMEDWVDLSGENGSGEGVAQFRALHGCGHYHVDYEMMDDAWHIATQRLYRTRLDIVR
ncbi:nuclear transport factor 2 family protein [Inquilinus limosus]|nr:nuclear transport factor 2 family protein [Inquilinus limosus]